MGIGAGLPGEGDAQAERVGEIAMTAAPAAIDEAGALKLADEFANFLGHGSIKTILACRTSGLFRAIAETPHHVF